MPTSDFDRRDFMKLAAAGAAFLPSGLGLAQADLRPGAPELRFRQVHLDFHTSEDIEGIGAKFDPEEFADVVEGARINSITCFGRCHHGWIYYRTKKFPERRHPHLERDLLEEQIEVLHKRNIRVPIYLTIQWDHYTAMRYPEWLTRDPEGRPQRGERFEPGFYRRLCVNSPYRDFIKEQIADLFDAVPVDGLFLDIVTPQTCSCQWCIPLQQEAGLNPADPEHQRRHALDTINAYKLEMTDYIRGFSKDCTIFYNAGHIGPRHRPVAEAYTHWELESLPSGGWGYLDFPLKVRYTRTLGMENLGMTGKFHTSWGDFHSYKNQAALEYECFQMLALGAKCSVGDQLPPDGLIDKAAYELIGSVYKEVEKKEPWCAGARPVVDIGVLTPEEFLGGAARSIPGAAFGATRMLQELGMQFDMLDSKSDFSNYKLLVLPDNIPVSPELGRKIDGYVDGGGALLASFESGLDPDGERFALRSLGLRYRGDAPYSPDFLVPKGEIGDGLPGVEHVMYLKGKQVELAGAQELVPALVPYFNRTWEHFCSHRHTPSSGEYGYPGVTRHGRTVYFMHPVFGQYHKNAPRWVKAMVGNAIGLLLPDPIVRVDAPSSALTAVNEQRDRNRWVVHLLHYIPERRGQEFDVIEDVIPILNVKVSVAAPRAVRAVELAPVGSSIEFETKGGRTEFTVPRVDGHQMVSISFA